MVGAPLQSGVYTGWLRHRRTSPVAHAFTYPLFMVLLDIDRIPELMAASPVTSYNRWNWASFHDRDHLGPLTVPMRERLARDAGAHGHTLPDGAVFLLTHLRYLGHCFNPVSFFYCCDRDGAVRLVLAEVNNTFGGSHRYWLEPRDASSTTLRSAADKSFYVSPFMPADAHYTFAFTRPAATLAAHMALDGRGSDGRSHAFDATLRLERAPWTAAAIVRALVRHPAMTAGVVAGIHVEALRLWWKGLPIVPRPTPTGVNPDHAVPESGRR